MSEENIEKIGSFKVKHKKTVIVEEYSIPSSDFTDSKGNSYIALTEFTENYLKSSERKKGLMPVSLISIDSSFRKDIFIPSPNNKSVGLEEIINNKEELFVRSNSKKNTEIIPYKNASLNIMKLIDIPKQEIKHFIDSKGKYIATIARTNKEGTFSVSTLEGSSISKTSFESFYDFWQLSDVLFNKKYACFLHSVKTDEKGWWDSEEVSDYINIIDLKLKSSKTINFIPENKSSMHFTTNPVLLTDTIVSPLTKPTDYKYGGKAPLKGFSLTNIESEETKFIKNEEISFLKDKEYVPLWGIADRNKARYFLADGLNYMVITINTKGSIKKEFEFKGVNLADSELPSWFKLYNKYNENFDTNKLMRSEVTNISVNGDVINALFRPNYSRNLYAVAFSYDKKTHEYSFFPLPKVGKEILLDEMEQTVEFFRSKQGKNIFSQKGPAELKQ